MERRSQLVVPLLLGLLACGNGRKNSIPPDPNEAMADGGVPSLGSGGRSNEGGALGYTSSASGDGGIATGGELGVAVNQGGAAGEAPAPVSRYCGDGIRDPITEACDDGANEDEDSCSASCETRNLLVVDDDGATKLARRLGYGPHPLAASDSGAALVFTEISGSSASLRLARFSNSGQRLSGPISLSSGLSPGDSSNPVLAGLGAGAYVAAWSDASHGSLDVVLRAVSSEGALGEPKLANSSVSGAQFDPDLLWSNGQLVAIWTDGFAVKSRIFSANLESMTPEVTLSQANFAGNASLTTHAGSWAAAFRESSELGGEQIGVVLGDTTRFTVGPFDAGPTDERPAIASLDDEHLLLVYCTSATGTSRLAAFVIDVNAPDEPVSVALEPHFQPYAGDGSLAQHRPSLARVGAQLFLAWQTASPLGDPVDQELFVRELVWNPETPGEVAVAAENTLLIDWMHGGKQQSPVLAGVSLGNGEALLSVFEHGDVRPGSKVIPELVLGFVPWPRPAVESTGGAQ
jgi:cysteine-rich repeat protein